MKAHNPILLDFIKYKMQVIQKEKSVELKGIHHQGELKSMSINGTKQLLKKGQSICAHLFAISATEHQEPERVHVGITTVVQ